MCRLCLPNTFPDLPSRCYKCKRITSNFAVCGRCKKLTSLRHVWIRTDYDHTAKTLLRMYKFERARSAVTPITELMDESLPYLPKDTVLIPVPTATSRVRQRGYDHAALLARGIAQKQGFFWLRAVTHLSQSRQVGANRQKRLTQLHNALIVTKPVLVKGRHILIVDDVVTTGATIETMARVLKKAGAKSVNALVFTQKQ